MWRIPPRELGAFIESLRVPPVAPPARLVSNDNTLTLRGYTLSGGDAVLKPLRRPMLKSVAHGRAAGAEWVDPRIHGASPDWQPLQATMPRARLVAEARRPAPPDPELATVDLETMALLDRRLPPLAGTAGTATRCRFVDTVECR